MTRTWIVAIVAVILIVVASRYSYNKWSASQFDKQCIKDGGWVEKSGSTCNFIF